MGESEDLLASYEASLAGRVGLVTGAGSGIGRAIAVALARAGASVALLGRRRHRLDETAALIGAHRGGGTVVLPTDAADPGQVEDAVRTTTSSLGPPDIAVMAAGVNAWAPLEELAPDLLRSVLQANVEGVVNVARAVVPSMRDRGNGKLIVVASDNGRRAEAGGSGYVASKFGAVGFSLSLSQELYATGVSVHVVEPGCVNTDWYPPEEDAPRDRMLRAEDVALVALFLATLPQHVVLEEVTMLPRGLLAQPWI